MSKIVISGRGVQKLTADEMGPKSAWIGLDVWGYVVGMSKHDVDALLNASDLRPPFTVTIEFREREPDDCDPGVI